MFELTHPAWQQTPCISFAGSGRRKGYGYSQFQGRQYLAHRLAFALNQMVHPQALAGVVIRHTCDNRECINVGHLLPGTHADNQQDKVARNRQLKGEQIAQHKLTAAQVSQLRSLYAGGGCTQRDIASRFGISQSAVSFIVNQRRWKHL